MSPSSSFAWVVWVALVASGEASFGDRNWLYIDCLDLCVQKVCGITYYREEDPDLAELSAKEARQKALLRNRLDQRLTHLDYLDLDLDLDLDLEREEEEENNGGEGRKNAGLPDPPSEAGAGATGAKAPPPGSTMRRRLLLDDGDEDRGAANANANGDGQERSQASASGGEGKKAPPADVAEESGGGGGGDSGGGSVAKSARAVAGGLGGPEAKGPGGGAAVDRRALAEQAAAAGGDGAAGGGGKAAAAAAVDPVAAVDRYVHQPPWYLRAMGWDCEAECRHTCMNVHVEARMAWGDRMLQYYGKWPFRRVWGVQEVFSSLFSAGNGLPHLYHLVKSPGLYNPPGNYMRFWLTLYPWVGMNTWLWSTVFHARDVPWTEAADYFCALLNIFFVVWVALLRFAGPPRKRSRRLRKVVPAVGVSMSVYYLLHISFLWFIKFDYGYNMKVALLAGVAHTSLWLRYLYLVRDRPYAKRAATIMILLNAAILLEVNDFPPLYRLLDAHAIWHGVTIPLMFYWYRFMIQDARHEVLLASAKET